MIAAPKNVKPLYLSVLYPTTLGGFTTNVAAVCSLWFKVFLFGSGYAGLGNTEYLEVRL